MCGLKPRLIEIVSIKRHKNFHHSRDICNSCNAAGPNFAIAVRIVVLRNAGLAQIAAAVVQTVAVDKQIAVSLLKLFRIICLRKHIQNVVTIYSDSFISGFDSLSHQSFSDVILGIQDFIPDSIVDDENVVISWSKKDRVVAAQIFCGVMSKMIFHMFMFRSSQCGISDIRLNTQHYRRSISSSTQNQSRHHLNQDLFVESIRVLHPSSINLINKDYQRRMEIDDRQTSTSYQEMNVFGR